MVGHSRVACIEGSVFNYIQQIRPVSVSTVNLFENPVVVRFYEARHYTAISLFRCGQSGHKTGNEVVHY
jgi:hypothetical protein